MGQPVPPATETDCHIQSLSYDRYSMVINGQRVFIRSGAMHYFRLPSQDLWYDRLYKLKVAGYNTVDLYFNWGFHSSADGVYDFSGIRDVKCLLEMAQELGLWVIARPGPYINAEVSGGGFPMWLLAKKDLPLRNRRNGAFEWSDEYVGYVRQWWSQILPIVNQFDNVLMVQIENEYSTLEVEPDYMQALYQMARDFGVKVPLSHNDLFIAGLYEDVVDLYAFDNYSVTQFDSDWRNMGGIFSVLDNVEQNIRPFCQNRPLIAAELQAGWFGMWKGLPYQEIVQYLGRDHINVSTKTVLGQGLTVFNHYKAIGGTNWGHIGSTETYTSYDFGAPISEVGLNTIRLFEAKSLNYLLDSFDLNATERMEESTQWPFTTSSPDSVYVVRKNVESEGYWVFFRNLEEAPKQVNLTFAYGMLGNRALSISLKPHDMLMLPCLTRLKCGFQLLYSNVEPLYQNQQCLVLRGGQRAVRLALKHDKGLQLKELQTTIGESLSVNVVEEGLLEINSEVLSERAIAHIQITDGENTVTVIALGTYWADRFWTDKRLLGERIFIGPDALLSDAGYSVADGVEDMYHLYPDGTLREVSLPKLKRSLHLPKLERWKVYDAAPEMFSQTSFKPISATGLDLDANGQFEGSAWYALSFGKDKPKQLKIDATHIWAIYLNGQFVVDGHHLQLIHEETENPVYTVELPSEAYQDDNNRLLVFVDSLGHPKGFHDDEQESQGLLRLWVDDVPVRETRYALTFSGGLACEISNLLPELVPGKQLVPLVYAEASFQLPDMEDWNAPLGLNVPGLDCVRANVYINGVLIGRYWEACKAQDSFYLPKGLVKTEEGAVNRLALLLMDFEGKVTPEEYLSRLSNPDNISLMTFDTLYKYRRHV